MTPYEIEILMHYFTRCNEHPDVERQPPVWRPTMQQFLDDGLVTYRADADPLYAITPRGAAYCRALQEVPLPRQEWVIDWPITPHRRVNA